MGQPYFGKSLSLITGLSVLIYLLVFSLPFGLSQNYHIIPPVDYAKLTGHSAAGFTAYVAGLIALFGLYLWAIRLTAPTAAKQPEGKASRRAAASLPPDSSPLPGSRFVLITGAILAAILVFSYPLTAIDLFIYAIRTRGWAIYGLNPLGTAPAAFPAGEPWLGLAAEWMDAPSPYGPVWEWLSLGAYHLSGGNFLVHLFALKIVAALTYLGCTGLVYLILRQTQPAWAITGTIAFAWNPLTLLESAQNGHNDIVMAFFLLAAVWGIMRPARKPGNEAATMEQNSPSTIHPSPAAIRHSLICLCLALSILVKFVTVLVVPFFLLALTTPHKSWAVRLGWMTGYGCIITGLVLLGMWPLWPGWDTWAVWQAGGQAGRSLLALLVLSLRNSIGLSWAFDGSNYLLGTIFAAIYFYYLWQMVRAVNSNQLSAISRQNPETNHQLSISSTGQPSNLPTFQPFNFLTASFLVLFWYVLLAAPVFHAWYVLWFLPLAPLLLPHRRPLNAATIFTITALFIIPYFETIRVWYPALLNNQLVGHLVGVPLLIGPPALALLYPGREDWLIPGSQAEPANGR